MALILFFAFALLYGYTLAHHYTYDGLCYALDAERGPLVNIFHPGHLLYSITQRALWHGAAFLGYHGPALYWMQAVNVVVSAASVALLGVLISRKTTRVTAGAGAALFGVSYAFWSEAADPGCYAFAALAAVGTLWLLIEGPPEKSSWVGAAHGAMVLYHQMLILVAPAFLLRYSWKYLIGLLVTAALPYAVVATVFHGTSLHDALYWALGPAGPPPGTPVLSSYWWSVDMWGNAKIFVSSLARACVGGEGPRAWVGYGVAATVVGMAVYRGRHGPLWVWLAALGAFEFFFAPGTLRFRILLLPPLIYLALAGRKAVWMWGVVAVVAAFNATPIYTKMQRPADAARVAWLRQVMTPSDFLVYSGKSPESITNVYFVYFAPRLSGQSLSGYFFTHKSGDWGDLNARLTDIKANGGRVFVEEKIWRSDYKKGVVLEGPDGYRLFQAR